MKIKPLIKNEFGKLSHVILGTAEGFGGVPAIEKAYDPKSKEHILKGSYPSKKDVILELKSFKEVLEKYHVSVFSPETIDNENQVFTRDVGFVVGDVYFEANMLEERKGEFPAVVAILNELGIDESKRVKVDMPVRFEGGDIMPHNEVIFIGYEEEPDFSEFKVSRTNIHGVNFIKDKFPDNEVFSFELNKSDDDARLNALHLDCCFQPLGLGHCLIYEGGFKHKKDFDFLVEYMGAENCIEITQQEMYDMGTNVFSIQKNVVVSNSKQTRINNELRLRGYIVEEVVYNEISKMGGLFRCSTMPLCRIG